jgi:hypothetical protein
MGIIEKLGITPGPWEAQRGQEINPETMIYVCHPNTECDETTVCNFDEEDDRENHFSNAQLIAAAPEMLEALIDLTLTIENDYYIRESDRKKDYPLDCMKVIEKATGKSWEEIKELIK